MKKTLILSFWITITFLFEIPICKGQEFSKGIGGSGFAPYFNKVFRIKNHLYSINQLSIETEPNINSYMAKMDLEGKIVWQKKFRFEGYYAAGFQTFQQGDFFYTLGGLQKISPDTNFILLQKIDTNGNFIISRRIKNSNLGVIHDLDIQDKNFYVSGVAGKSMIGILDTNLHFSKIKLLTDTLNRGVQIVEFLKNNNTILMGLNTKSMAPDNVKPAYIQMDTALVQRKGKIYPIETDAGIGQNNSAFFPLDSSHVFTLTSLRLSPSQYLYFSIWNLIKDSLSFIDLRFPVNPVLDTFPILQSQERSSFSHLDSLGNLNYYHYRIYDTDEFRNCSMVGKWNPLTGAFQNFRRKGAISIAPKENNKESKNRFSLLASRKFQATDFYGQGLYENIDLQDTTNCLAVKDTFATVIYGPKVKLEPYRILMKDTVLTMENLPVLELPIRLCEFDFCNPPSFAGLGSDISTCEDSVWLYGAVAYLGQNLQWSTGDTTIKLKVKVGNTYSVKISGVCGTFKDTVQVVLNALGAVQFTQQSDTLTTCKPVLLQPVAQQWISPRWFTPKGEVLDSLKLIADTTGLYIVQNDVGDCARRDTIFIDLQPIVRPYLQLPDTITTCKDLVLSPQASQWTNPAWQTPGGAFGSISITADLTGKYVIQNNVLGCPAKDSVYIIRKNPSLVSFFNQPDTLFTCKSILLAPVAQPFINPNWQTPSGNFTGINTFAATTSGKYKITNDNGNCANADSIVVVFSDTAQIDFVLRSGGKTIIKPDTLLKDNQFPFIVDAITQTQAVRYRWFLNGAHQNGNSFSQGFTFENEGDFRIKLITTTSDSCLGKAEKTLNLNRLVLPPLDIPNLVTQNGDHKNDRFEILQLPFYPDNQLTIFNRWGVEVFKASPYQNDWPPSDWQPGIYFYKLTAANQVFSGWVDVVK